MSLFLESTLPSPKSPGGRSIGAPVVTSAVQRSPAPGRFWLADCGWTAAGLGERAPRYQEIGSPGNPFQEGLRSRWEAPLFEEAIVNFVLKPQFQDLLPLWGTACLRACFSASGVPSPRPESPALGDHQRSSPLLALFFPVPACRTSGGPATRSHWLQAPGGGKDGEAGP